MALYYRLRQIPCYSPLMHWWEQWLGEDLLCKITTIVRQCGAGTRYDDAVTSPVFVSVSVVGFVIGANLS